MKNVRLPIVIVTLSILACLTESAAQSGHVAGTGGGHGGGRGGRSRKAVLAWALNSASFGQIQTAGDPRLMQFAVKFTF